jgi:uncharacterized membrane protein YagU involved in acid resistance
MDVGTWGFIASAAGAVAFVLTYSLVAPWWRTPAGRYVWAFSVSVTFLISLASYRLAFGRPPFWDQLRAAGYVLLATVIWTAEIALIRVQVLRLKAIDDKKRDNQKDQKV